MRMLITGGAGFQGSHLAERWSGAGHDVTILNTYSEEAARNVRAVSSDAEVVWGSVTDDEIVQKTVRGHDVVVHLAARVNVDESLDAPRAFADVNLGGTINVLEAARRSGARVVFASSCEVYGASDGLPVPETAPLRPFSPYAASKAAADRMCHAYHMSYGLDVTVVRPSNVYGERQKSGRGGAVIPIFASLAAAGKPLTVFGTGEQTREYIHVSDLVAAYDAIVARGDLAGETVNVGTGDIVSIRAIAEFIANRAGVEISQQPARPGEVPRFSLDSALARSFGFEPKVEFWAGLGRYVDTRLEEQEDAALARAIDEGLEAERVSRQAVEEALHEDRDEA